MSAETRPLQDHTGHKTLSFKQEGKTSGRDVEATGIEREAKRELSTQCSGLWSSCSKQQDCSWRWCQLGGGVNWCSSWRNTIRGGRSDAKWDEERAAWWRENSPTVEDRGKLPAELLTQLCSKPGSCWPKRRKENSKEETSTIQGIKNAEKDASSLMTKTIFSMRSFCATPCIICGHSQ